MGGSYPWDFLLSHFGKAECLADYRRDVMDLEEHWTFSVGFYQLCSSTPDEYFAS